MDTKEELIQCIKDWIKNDNQMKELNKEIRNIRKKQTDISKKLMETMKKNELEYLNTSTGKIVYSQTKVKQSLSKKNLLLILSKYFEDGEKAAELSNFIMENREEKIREIIKKK